MPPFGTQTTTPGVSPRLRRRTTFNNVPGVNQSTPQLQFSLPRTSTTPQRQTTQQNAAAQTPVATPRPRQTTAPSPLAGQLESIRQQALGIQEGLNRLRTQRDALTIPTPQVSETRERFAATFQPTDTETRLQEQINQALESEELGLQRISEQAIPQGLLVGQQAALQRQAAIQTTPLQRQLALLQQERTGEREALGAQLELEQQDIQTQQAQQQQIQNIALSAIQAGASEQQIQGILRSPNINAALQQAAATGVLRTPEELNTQVVSAGGRQLLVNTQTGETIQDLGPTEGALGRAADAAATDIAQTGISPVTGRPFTESQSRAGAFAARVQEAEEVLSGGRGFFVPFLPTFLRTGDRRQFEQAETNFITAVLRRESGAAIAPSEFDDARDVYIPRATDDQTTLQQKAEARRIIFEGLRNESVGAFNQIQQSLGRGDSGGAIEVNGALFQQNPDGSVTRIR